VLEYVVCQSPVLSFGEIVGGDELHRHESRAPHCGITERGVSYSVLGDVYWKRSRPHHYSGARPGDFMGLDPRIATRHVFESRILIHLRRGGRNLAVSGWARDLSQSGLQAFVAEELVVGESVSLEIPLPPSGKETIPAKVARQLGTQYGFQFTALSAQQRSGIRTALRKAPAISHSGVKP